MTGLDPLAVAEFIAGLTELSNRTGIVISACGCCNGPYLILRDDGQVIATYTHDNGDRVTPEYKPESEQDQVAQPEHQTEQTTTYQTKEVDPWQPPLQ